MDIDELRESIWEHLFRTKATKSIGEIAALTGHEASAVRAAVEHQWFHTANEDVSIAYTAPQR